MDARRLVVAALAGSLVTASGSTRGQTPAPALHPFCRAGTHAVCSPPPKCTCVANQLVYLTGKVVGLSGKGLTLLNEGYSFGVSANGSVTILGRAYEGYGIGVSADPTDPLQGCYVDNGYGVATASGNSQPFTVICGTPYTVGGTITGLISGSSAPYLMLSLSSPGVVGPVQTEKLNGDFTFAMPLANGRPYQVVLASNPNRENCGIANGSGTIAERPRTRRRGQASNVTNVLVSCSPTVTIAALGVANYRAQVNEYPVNASGNVAPSSTLAIPEPSVFGPAFASNSVSGLNVGYGVGDPPSLAGVIASYAPGASGNANPVTTITGPHTGLNNAGGMSLALDAAGNIYATVSPTITQAPPQDWVPNPVVLIFARGADGDQAPIATIAGSHTQLVSPFKVAVDGKGQVYVLDTSPFINVYAAGAKGNVAPIAKIAGSQTGFQDPQAIAVDSAGTIYVADAGTDPFYVPGQILIFAPGANGNVAPQRTFSGAGTFLPVSIAVDSGGSIYVGNLATQPANVPPQQSIAVFGPTSTGNATPSATILGETSTSLTFVGSMTVLTTAP
jgi:hypothetical protein